MAELRPFRNISFGGTSPKEQNVAAAGMQKEEEIFQKTGMYLSDINTARQQSADMQNLSDAELSYRYGQDAVQQRRAGASQGYRDALTTSIDRTLDEHVRDAGVAVGEGAVGLVEGLHALGGLMGDYSVQGLANKLGRELSGNDAREQGAAMLRDAREFIAKGYSDSSKANREAVQRDKQNRNAADKIDYAEDLINDPGLMTEIKQIGRESANAFNATVSNPTELANAAIGQLPQLALAAPAKAFGAAGAGAAALRSLTTKVGAAEARRLLADGTSAVAREALEEGASRGFRNAMGAFVGATEGGSAGAQAYEEIIKLDEKQLDKQSAEYRELRKAGVSHEDARRQLAEETARLSMAIAAPIAAVTGRVFSGFEANPLGAAGSSAGARLLRSATDIGKEMVEEAIQGGGSQLGQNYAAQASGADDNRNLIEGVGDQVGTGAAVAGAFTGAIRTPSLAVNAVGVPAGMLKNAITTGLSERADRRQSAEQAEAAQVRQQVAGEAHSAVQRLSEIDAQTAAPIMAELGPNTVENSASLAALPEEVRAELTNAPTADGQSLDPVFDMLEQVQKAERAVKSGKFNDQPMTMANIAATAVDTMRRLRAANSQLLSAMENNDEDTEVYQDAKLAYDALAGFESNDFIKQSMEFFKNADDESVAQIAANLSSDNEVDRNAAISAISALSQAAPERVSVEAANQVLSQSNLPEGIRRNMEVIRDTGIAAHAHEQRIAELQASVRNTSEVGAQIKTEGWDKNRRSVDQYRADAMNALMQGDTQKFDETLNRLGNWIQKYQLPKVRNGDVAALRAMATGKSVDVQDYGQLNSTGTSTTSKPFRMHNNPGSLAQVGVWQADAQLMVDTYNALAQYSQGEVAPFTVPTVRSADLTGSSPRAAAVDASMAELRSLRVNGQVDDAGFVTPDMSRQFKQNQKNPKVYSQAGRQLTTTEVNNLRGVDQNRSLSDSELSPARTQKVESTPTPVQDTNSQEQGVGEGTEAANREAQPTEAAGSVTEATTANVSSETAVDDNTQPSVVATDNAPAEPSQSDAPTQAEQEVDNEVEADVVEETKPVPFETLSDVEVAEDATPEQKLGARNVLKHDFTMVANSDTPMGKFGADASAEIAKAFNTSLSEVQNIFGKDVFFTADEMAAMGTMFGNIVPLMKKALNEKLNSASNKTTLNAIKKWQEGGSKFVPWTRANLKSLYATNMSKTSTTLEYDPSILEGMALGTIQYLTNHGMQKPFAQANQVAAFLGKAETDLVPGDMKPFQEGFVQKAVIAELANHITAALSLRADPSVTVDVSDGLAKSLAGDVLSFLQDSGVLDVRYYELIEDADSEGKSFGKRLDKPAEGTAPFITFHTDRNGAFSNFANAIRSSRRDFNKVLNTGVSLPMWSVGAPVKNTERNISGTQQKLSNKQKRVLNNHNNIPFYFNERFVEMFESMGRERFLRMIGHQSVEDESMNITHKEAVEGKNMSLDRAYDAVLQLVEDLKRHSEQTGEVMTNIPTYFDWYVTTNGRVMMNGIGPQADKLLREVLSPNKVEMDRTNPIHVRDLGLAVAQALGQKTENLTHAEVADWIENKLVSPETPNAQSTALNSLIEGDSPLEVMEAYHAAVGAPLSVREINALQTYAEFIKSNDDKMDVYLAFELDGKTDGPVNAMGQFGLWNPVANTMLNLERGGYFFNKDGELTINTENKRLKKDGIDLYDATSKSVQSDVREILSANGENALSTKRQLHLITQLGMIRTPDGQPYNWMDANFLRNLTKQAVTSTGYAGSQAAIAGNFAQQVRTYLAQQLTRAYQNQEQISAADQAAINGLIGKAIDFSDYKTYPNIQLSSAQMGALRTAFKEGMASVIYNAIQREMGDTISTMSLIVQSTQVQYQLLSSEYESAYAKLRNERIAEGKILSHQPLSRADERSILKSLEAFHPILQLAGTQDMLSRDFGIGIAETERGQSFTQPGKDRPEAVSSMFGNRFSSDIARTNIMEPGVRAAALFNIAIGDSNMMTEMFSKVRAALNVWDGYEASIGAVDESAYDVNKAVYDSWKFDALGTAVQNLERSLSRAAQMKIDVPGVKLNNVKFVQAAKQGATPASVLLDELRARQAATVAVKEALQKAPSSIDHMSGGMKPYTANQGAAVIPQAELQRIATDAGMASVNAPQETNAPKADAAITAATKEQRTFGKTDLTAMLDAADLDMTQKYIWGVVKKLVPDNVRVYYGTEANLRELFAQNHPDAVFPANVRGVSIGDSIYVSNKSAETTLHEVTHAAMHNVLDRAYNQSGKGLSGDQKAAASALKALSEEFHKIPVSTLPAVYADVFEQVQSLVKGYSMQGNTYAAVQEMIAWTTNPRVSETLSNRSLPKKLAQIIGNIVDQVRRLLGLGTNANNWLAAMLSKVTTLGNDTAVDSNTSIMPLAQVNVTPEHLSNMTDRLEQVVQEATTDPVKAAQLVSIDAVAAKSYAQLQAAGFQFDPATERAFLEMQTAMGLNVKSNPRAMNLAQSLFDVAMRELTPASFDATSINAAQAQAKYDALFSTVGNIDGRSALLSNFLGMALVNDEVRNVLSNMKPDPKTKVEGDFGGRINSLFTRLFDEIGNVGLGQKGASNLVSAIDQLYPHLFYFDQKIKSGMGLLDTANDIARDGINKVGTKLQSIASARASSAQQAGLSVANKFVTGAVAGLAAMTSTASAKEFGEFALSLSNDSKLAKPLRELIAELVGTTDGNEAVNLLINKTKYAVSHVRQNLRDQLPATLNGKFKKPVEVETWKSVHSSVGMSDAQALLGSYTGAQIADMYVNDTARQAEIQSAENALASLAHGSEYIAHAKDLATVMMGKGVHSSKFFYRNAYAIARLPHLTQQSKIAPKDAVQAEPIIDKLVSLYAMDMVDAESRAKASEFLKDEGGQFVLNYLQNLTQRESDKSVKQKFNAWKGNIPTSTDGRKRVVLATAAEGLNLERQSWVKVGTYQGDNADFAKLSYYASTSAQMSSFNQGAFQTAEETVSGVNALTGRTIDGRTNGVISADHQVKAITAQKLRAKNVTGMQLLPVMAADGSIIAYERMLDPSISGRYTKQSGNLADSIGMWEGRMVEEGLAKVMNNHVADSLVQRWKEDSAAGRSSEFVDVSKSKDKVVSDAWNSLPHATQNYLRDQFGGAVMIRKDMVNNAMGYRSASVRDVFNGASNISEPVRRQMYEAAMSLMGKNAYKYLSHTEAGIQAVIGQAKDIIVVRSLVVGVVNMISNQLQLMAHGINPVHAAKIQARTLSEVNTHRKYEQQRIEIAAELAVEKDPAKRRALETKAQSLVDASKRLMIAPLIEAGELPTIAEGLTEQDEFSIISDFAGWAESKTQFLPDSVMTVAKWATVAKDTPLYKGMNRMVSYGDFVAKMAVYDHLTRVKGLDSKQAIREVSEEFVNYNFLPGRTRSYLESVGMTWFANYKLRIQKILLRHVRENPLRSLMIAGGASAMGIEHLFSAVPWEINYGYMLGPEPVLSAHESIIWNQLMK